MKPLVSVITVVYNGAATLEETIQSVAGQTFTDREFIIVDGGSTDASPDIIKKYAGTVVTRWISEPDKGVYDAMNKGIRMAGGEFLFFLGSDDKFHDDQVLSAMFASIPPDTIDLLYGDVISPSYAGRYDGPFDYPKLLSRNLSHQAAFYRKRLFGRLGDYDLRFRRHADWDFNLRCFADAAVTTQYRPVLVASFGAEGISAGHDIPFLRQSLIPAKLRWLNQEPSHPLRRIGAFDEWWRFLRNAGITEASILTPYIGDEPLPRVIRGMIRWQRLVPSSLLRFGPFSKTWMLTAFGWARITGAL